MNNGLSRAHELPMPLSVGLETVFVRTIEARDVEEFARITGDFSANHFDAALMQNSAYGQRMVHGALLVGLMSAASTRLLEQVGVDYALETPVSQGFDRVRFVAPVFIGETVRVRYRIARIDATLRKAWADIVIEKNEGETVAVGVNVLRWVRN